MTCFRFPLNEEEPKIQLAQTWQAKIKEWDSSVLIKSNFLTFFNKSDQTVDTTFRSCI
jgi:hypothetical protein